MKHNCFRKTFGTPKHEGRRRPTRLSSLTTVHATSTCICVSILRNTASGAAEHQAAVRGGNEASQQPPPFSMPACTFMFPCIPSWHDARWMLPILLVVGIHHKRAYSMCHWRQVACSPQRPVLVHNRKRLHVFMCSLPFALLLFLHSPLEPVDIVIGTVRISSKTLGLLLGRRSALRT